MEILKLANHQYYERCFDLPRRRGPGDIPAMVKYLDMPKMKAVNESLIRELADYCDSKFIKCSDCASCNHPSGKCSGSCADCLHEIQYHRSGERANYDCRNMLRYYTCHTIWKRCSEILYALETLDLNKYPVFDILSIGCGAAPDLMAFDWLKQCRPILYHGIDIGSKWDEI